MLILLCTATTLAGFMVGFILSVYFSEVIFNARMARLHQRWLKDRPVRDGEFDDLHEFAFLMSSYDMAVQEGYMILTRRKVHETPITLDGITKWSESLKERNATPLMRVGDGRNMKPSYERIAERLREIDNRRQEG